MWNRVHEENIPVTQADLRDLIEMEVANYLEFMPRSHFTVEELDTFEAKVERGKPLLSPPGLQSDQGRNRIETPYHSLVGREVTSHNTSVPRLRAAPFAQPLRGSGTAGTLHASGARFPTTLPQQIVHKNQKPS